MLDSLVHHQPNTTNLPGLREQDMRGASVSLEADPTPVRVSLPTPAGRLAVTVAPLEPTARFNHIAVLRDLEGPADAPALPMLLYLALQRARIWQRSIVVTDDPILAAGPLQMSIRVSGELRAQTLDLAMHRLFSACGPEARAGLVGRFVAESLATLERRAQAFARNAWCRAVREHRLSLAQYVAALANTHQYVRFTPRLLARAIADSDDEDMRDHFFHHLRGEQKHDRLIEADLRYLGVDVEYVARAMVPSTATQAFMVVQESMIAFYHDPARFIGAPFVAEGLAAHIEPEFFHHLFANIRRWGYGEPAMATRFLASHARIDGGDDGHFAHSIAILPRLIADDAAQQRFLGVLHLAADAFTRSYDAYAEHYDLPL